MNCVRHREHGVGIIEVMVALALMMFAALAISKLQTEAFISMKISDTHFSVNEKTQDMLEILRANKSDAKTGLYNLDYDSTFDISTDPHPVLMYIAAWKNHINTQLPGGAGQINCDSSRCQVSIRWRENINGSDANQYFHIAGLI